MKLKFQILLVQGYFYQLLNRIYYSLFYLSCMFPLVADAVLESMEKTAKTPIVPRSFLQIIEPTIDDLVPCKLILQTNIMFIFLLY